MNTDNTAIEIMCAGVSNRMLRCCGFFARITLSGKRSKACCVKGDW